MRVLHVASEVYPLIKTGGLADVAAALPAALMRIGVDARILVPGYPAVLDKLADLRPVRTLADPWTTGGDFGVRVHTIDTGGVPLTFAVAVLRTSAVTVSVPGLVPA